MELVKRLASRRYSTLNALEGRVTRVLRPRIYVQSALLGAVLVVGIVGLVLRNPLGLDVMRDRNALYRATSDGWIENVYSVRMLNKDHRDHVLTLSVSGIDGVRLAEDSARWLVRAGDIRVAPVRIRVPSGTVRGGHDLRLAITSANDPGVTRTEKARFIAP